MAKGDPPKECIFRDCATPRNDVKQVVIICEEDEEVADLCAGHREPIDDIMAIAHQKRRRRGPRAIKVVSDPSEIPRKRRP